jgi:hypothetical protein
VTTVRLKPRRGRLILFFVAAFAAVVVPVASLLVLAAVGARAGSWAARIDPPADVEPLPVGELRARLLELNDLEAPFQLRQRKQSSLVAEWRIADARWTGLFEKAGLSVAHSVRIRLDPKRRRVRAIDTHKKLRWSAGAPRASWAFSFFRGITFYHVESEKAFGVLLVDGQWKVDRAYDYSFNINELKRPVVEAVVRGGWTWQPVVTFFRPLGG